MRTLSYSKFLSQDARLRSLLKSAPSFRLTSKKNLFLHLCLSIIAQQLSTKVAAILEKRFLLLLSGSSRSPDDVLAIPTDALRSIGLSGQKARYVHNIATYFKELELTDRKIRSLDDESIIELLTPIKGVGRWTVEMLLIFALGRTDVFAVDDLVIRKSMIDIYGLKSKDRRTLSAEMSEIAKLWSPHRSYACLLLWHSSTNRPG